MFKGMLKVASAKNRTKFIRNHQFFPVLIIPSKLHHHVHNNFFINHFKQLLK